MSTGPTVLLTGFAPFGGEETNPSWDAVREVARTWTGDAALHVRELPVAFGRAGDELRDALDAVRPDLVICVGQAAGDPDIRLERVAVNLDDARIPDAGGAQPLDEAIVADGPAAYFGGLPVKAAVAAVSALGIPARVSQTAGTYVCNHVFYRLMAELATRPGVRGGFVHVPASPDQRAAADGPSMPVADVAAALTAILAVTLDRTDDALLAGGTLD